MRSFIGRFSHRRLGGQAVIAFALKGVGAAFSFALTWLIARRFGADGSGLFGLAASTIQLAVFASMAGFDLILVRTASGDIKVGNIAAASGIIRACSRVILLHAFIIATLLWLFRGTVARTVLSMPGEAPLLAIMAWVVIPYAIVRSGTAALRAMGFVTAAMGLDGPVPTGMTVLIIATLFAFDVPFKIETAGMIMLGSYLLTAVAGWWMIKGTSVATTPPSSVGRVRTLYMSAAPILVASLSNFMIEWLSNVLISAKLSIDAVGIYRTAWQIVGILGLAQIAFDSIVGPRIAGQWRLGDKSGIASTVLQMSLLALALATPFLAVALLVPTWLLGIFGPEFTAGSTALRILALSQVVRLISGPFGSVLMMSGSRRWPYLYSLFNLLVFAVFSTTLIGLHGLEGAAMAVFLTMLLRSIATALVVRFALDIPLFNKAAIASVFRDVIGKHPDR